MVLAAVGSFAVSQALHLPEAFWAVLTALVAARPHAAGTARAGVDRVIGTVAGAFVATAFALTHLHLSQLELLLAVLVPLCLLVALHDNYRAAPIAALIVLSGGMLGDSPLGAALARTSEIAVGALVAFIVSALIIPRRADIRSFEHAASVARLLGRFAGQVLVPPHEREAAEKPSEGTKDQIRAELRELAVLTHHSRWSRSSDTGMSKLTKLLSALHADLGFIDRTIVRYPVREEAAAFEGPLREVSAAFQSLLNQAADAFAETAPAPRVEALDRAIAALDGAQPADDVRPGDTPTPQHLIFLLNTLRDDCRKLCLLLASNTRERHV